MKTSTPALRITREFRADATAVLRHDETLSIFIEESVRIEQEINAPLFSIGHKRSSADRPRQRLRELIAGTGNNQDFPGVTHS